MSDKRSWIADVALGFRLALADRKSVVRAVFVAAGVGISLAILLGVASIPHAVSSYSTRANSIAPVFADEPTPDSLRGFDVYESYYGQSLSGLAVVDAPLDFPPPPGISRLPGPGEFVISPALDKLLKSDQGELLRPRFDGQIIGIIDDTGLQGPAEMRFYRGLSQEQDPGMYGASGYIVSFGKPSTTSLSDATLFLTVIFAGLGAVILVPPLTFVSMAGRLSSASRDRRLAAMRLAGMSARQIRRVGAAETLPASILGVAIGFLLYFVGRGFVERIRFGNDSLFTSDVQPGWITGAIAVILVPIITVAVAIFGMRGVVVEPLGVARRARPKRQRMLWRLCILGAGVAGFVFLLLNPTVVKTDVGAVVLITSGVVVLLSVPLVLPVFVAWLIGRLPTGQSAGWLLGVRRVQADPAAHSRIISGVGVTLAGILVLQGMLYWLQTSIAEPSEVSSNQVIVQLTGGTKTLELTKDVGALPGIQSVKRESLLTLGWSGDKGEPLYASYLDCEGLKLYTDAPCTEGKAYQIGTGSPEDGAFPEAGTVLTLMRYDEKAEDYVPTDAAPGTMPEVTSVPLRVDADGQRTYPAGSVVFTTGVMPQSESELLDAAGATLFLTPDGTDPALIERVRNALHPFPNAYAFGGGEDAAPMSAINQTVDTLRTVLIVIAVTIILLAIAALIVASADQVSERRGAFAYLAASGVPRSELSKSVMYSAAVPTLLGVLLSSITGVAMTWAFIKLTGQDPVLAWGQIGSLVGLTIVLVGLAVAATLPAVRSATRPDSLPHD